MRTFLGQWPVLRQRREGDPFGRGLAAKSGKTDRLEPRTITADKVVKSICPYCGVGCGQNVYVKDDKVVHIEGDQNSPVSRGRRCPRGAGALELTTSPTRRYHVLYRRPHGADGERMPLDEALDKVADRVI